MQVVSQLENHLQKERDRMQSMMHHLYLSKRNPMDSRVGSRVGAEGARESRSGQTKNRVPPSAAHLPDGVTDGETSSNIKPEVG